MMTIEGKHMKSTIDMAREAGFEEGDGPHAGKLYSPHTYDPYSLTSELERFAALVRADERAKFFTPEEARIALEDTDFTWHHSVTQDMVEKLEAIRARSHT